MIDWLGSVDDVLVMVGLAFVLGLGCFALGHALFYVCAHRLAHTRAALTWQRLCLTGNSFPKVNVAADR
jgi:sterol desaturase/sphingolipid hydroxylase (fatty acid hydroxylase superfamily)